MSATAAVAQTSTGKDSKLSDEKTHLKADDRVLGILPKSKISVENLSLSNKPGFFKFKIDFSTLDYSDDIPAFFRYLSFHGNKIQCLDLSDCKLLGHRYDFVDDDIIRSLRDLSKSSNIQQFILFSNTAEKMPSELSINEQRLLSLELELNSDALAGIRLNRFLKEEGNISRPELIPESILALKFFSNEKAIFLAPWQNAENTIGQMDVLPSGQVDSRPSLQKIYKELKELIMKSFSWPAFCSNIFIDPPLNQEAGIQKKQTEMALLTYCENELKKAVEDKNWTPHNHRARFALETLTWLALIVKSINTNSGNYRYIGADKEKAILDCIQHILNGSVMSTKIKMLHLLKCHFIYNVTHINSNVIFNPLGGLVHVLHNRFLVHYLLAANVRSQSIALLLTELCKNSELPEANPSIKNGFKPEIVTFFNNALYREGVYNRIVFDVLLKLVDIKDISEKNKILLVLHCQSILKNKLKAKNSHYKTWSLLYSLLCSKLNKEMEVFLNTHENYKNDMLNTLYWQFLTKVVGLSEADKKSYEINFNNENHHLILAFRQNLNQDDEDDDDNNSDNKDENTLALHFDKFIKSIIKEGNEGFRKLRYDETQNAHLKTLFSNKGQSDKENLEKENLDKEKSGKEKSDKESAVTEKSEPLSKNTFEGSALKSLWSKSDIHMTFKEGQFIGYQLICTDNYWDMMTWGFGINCLNPTKGESKLLLLLLYGQHRAMLLRDEKGNIIAGCMLHLLLHNIHNPKPCLALGKLYHRDLPQEQKQASEIKLAIRMLFERLGATVGLKLGLPSYAFYEKETDLHRKISLNKCYPDRIKEGLCIFTQQGPINVSDYLNYKAGLDGDMYDCEILEHPTHRTCAVMYAYREISETPLSELEMSKVETELSTCFKSGPKTITANILDYFAGGFRAEQVTGNTLCFEWDRAKTAACNSSIAKATIETSEPVTAIVEPSAAVVATAAV